MRWTEKEYQDFLKRPNKNHIPVSVADLESSVGDESMAEKKAPRFDRPVSIHIHSKRKRLTDADGACSKYLIDAIIDAGILRDDSPKEVKEVIHSQEKTKGPEVTEVTIK